MTTYRGSCGSLPGLVAHQSAGEKPCGWCAQAGASARLAAEAITWRPSPVAAPFEPVTAIQARINAVTLLAEVEAYERARHGGRVVGFQSRRSEAA
jgi:hypothetical protein